jgi:hypothetical protein
MTPSTNGYYGKYQKRPPYTPRGPCLFILPKTAKPPSANKRGEILRKHGAKVFRPSVWKLSGASPELVKRLKESPEVARAYMIGKLVNVEVWHEYPLDEGVTFSLRLQEGGCAPHIEKDSMGRTIAPLRSLGIKSLYSGVVTMDDIQAYHKAVQNA